MFKINAPGVYLRSRRLFETSILNQDYVSYLHTSSLSTILFEFYPLIIKPKLPSTIVLLTIKTEKQTTHQVSYQFLLLSWLLFCALVIKPGSSRGFLQRLPSSFSNRSIIFAFVRTHGAGTSTPPCSQLLAKYVCCRAVADTFFPCFTEKN